MKALWIMVFCFSAWADVSTYIIKAKDAKSFEHLLKQKSITRFTSYKSSYFSSLLSFQGNIKDIDPKLISHYEEISEVSSQSITPADIVTAKTTDPYYTYQWGLDYQDQKVFNELTDIQNILIPGAKQFDIGYPKETPLLKKNALVAVIDTGVDYNHPDLKEAIYKNEVECINGEIPFNPDRSLDDNIYPGDCKGWDFTGRKELGTNRPEDYVGHGTHIAGIIAATRDNQMGVAGLSNQIKILPIKVLSQSSEDSQAIGTSDRLSKAILYAVQMEVDVINLSLGWPLSFDKEHLKEAVKEAVNKGVIVIAAAGNNDHGEPIMPCAYEGVICVGATDPNGEISDFSNYGAHVDILAPGNNILSTYPTAITPLFFDVNGYENKSGTSQAAPYVSALAAMIKAHEPELDADDVKAKLFTSAKKLVDQRKFVKKGIINIEKALTSQAKILMPRLKGFGRVKVNPETRNFNFDLQFDDFNTQPGLAKIILEASGDIQLDKRVFYVKGKQRVSIKGSIAKLDLNYKQDFTLKVTLNKKREIYKFQKSFYVELDELAEARSVSVQGLPPAQLPKLATLHYHHFPFDKPFYYVAHKQTNSTVLSILTEQQDKISPLGTTMLKDASSVLSIHRIDANFDGVADFIVRYIETKKVNGEDEQKIVFAYFNEKLRPLFTQKDTTGDRVKLINHSVFKLKFEGVILQDLDNFAWSKQRLEGHGEISVPVYLGFADQPAADQNPNPFSQLRRRAFSSKIYFYEPVIDEDNEGVLVTRTLNTNRFVDEVKKQIKFKPFERIFLLKFEAQSLTDISEGRFSLLVSKESMKRPASNHILKFHQLNDQSWEIENLAESKLMLSQFMIERGFDLDQDNLLPMQTNQKLVGYEKSTRLSWEEFSITDQLNYVEIIQKDQHDSLELPIKTYFAKDGTFRFFMTPSRIFMHKTTKDNAIKTETFPIHVSSFLPGVLFREQHYPIAIQTDLKNKPALYVDATQVASRNVYVITLDDQDKLYAPLKYNINIPEKCRALNPHVIGNTRYDYTVQCFDDAGISKLIYLPLSE
ncbi:MAG: hypothetical protein CME62_14210 [Halobacteriovoraceae bacterium]|nr:hypothetical protein [Halobacteriovoraceae bacterium]|tara:strand:+ start:18072 stop:21209 length:3138 start_codon:yes stop_codon:yes gene_type:complete